VLTHKPPGAWRLEVFIDINKKNAAVLSGSGDIPFDAPCALRQCAPGRRKSLKREAELWKSPS
jgi:hypothetical protein